MQVRKVKPGYRLVKSLFGKEIEIPEEWEIKKFDELFEFLITGTNSRSDLEESGDIQYIHYGDIHTKWNSVLDCDSEEIPSINKTKVERLPLLKDGDLIIVDASEDYEGSGISILLKNVKNKKIVSGLHTIALRNTDENISLDFKAYLTSIRFVKKQIIGYVTGISVYGLSKNNLKKVKIPIPPLPEQQEIASILSNTDSLIQQYDKVIESTKKLKTGLMQKLLTKGIGHTKFKKVKSLFGKYEEIPEDWIVNTINDIGKIVTGSTPSTKISDYYGTEFLWASPTDLGDGKNIEKTENMLSAKGFAISRKIPTRSVLFVCIGSTIGKIGMSIKKMATNQQINSVICKNNNPDFSYYQLSANSIKIKNMANQVAVPILNKSDFGTIKIQIPTDIDEQQKIASILSNVDSKISDLESQKSYLQILKKGLMQKLLTGELRVRV